jgi:hypothetical protein
MGVYLNYVSNAKSVTTKVAEQAGDPKLRGYASWGLKRYEEARSAGGDSAPTSLANREIAEVLRANYPKNTFSGAVR